MSAACAYWPEAGALDAFACFPELPALADREVKDGVRKGTYQRMVEHGELIVAGRRVSDTQALVAETLHRWGRAGCIVADRWREADLLQVVEALRYPRTALSLRGQGFKDGGEDVRRFREGVLGDRVTAPVSLLPRSAVGEARVVGDPAGNWKLAKAGMSGRRIRARDDAAAAILAVAEGERRRRPARPSGPKRLLIAKC